MIALNAALADATAKRMQAEGAYRQARLAGVSAEVNENTQALRQAKASAEEANDEPTADLLTQRMQVHEKTAWMLRSLLEA